MMFPLATRFWWTTVCSSWWFSRSDGAGFAAPTRDEGSRPAFGESGLGLAIIKAVADDVEIADRGGGGASLRFVKRLR